MGRNGRLIIYAVGMIDLEYNGHIDLLCVHPNFTPEESCHQCTKSGTVATAISRGCTILFVEGSDGAMPFSHSRGFLVLKLNGTNLYSTFRKKYFNSSNHHSTNVMTKMFFFSWKKSIAFVKSIAAKALNSLHFCCHCKGQRLVLRAAKIIRKQ